MAYKDDEKGREYSELRERAERSVPGRKTDQVVPSAADAFALVHELQVHEMELKLQNEELVRSRAEAEVARQRYADLFDFAPVAYLTISRDSLIEEANLACARLLGVERNKLISLRLAGFVEDAERPEFHRAVAKALAEREDVSCDVTVTSVDARRAKHCLQLTISPAAGERLRIAAVDVTDRRRAEERVLTSQKLEAIGQLAGGVAHDFNNMLTVILNHAQVALDATPADAPLHQNLEELREAAERAAALTRQLLALSRKQAVAPKILDLNSSLRRIAEILPRLLGEDVRVVLSLAPDLGLVEIDPVQVDQIVMNLAVNARDAMARGGTLTISTANVGDADDLLDPSRPPHARVRLTVADTGCGMDAETKAHVFEPFFTTKEVGRGTGLGLSTVFGIVKQWGGEISLRSAPNEGTTFVIDLLRSDEPTTPGSGRVPPPKATPRKNTETILIVEDEPSLLRIAKRVLSSVGYAVSVASSATEALARYEEDKEAFDLLLSDIIMPGMNGVELARHLRKTCASMRVLFMSGYSADALALRGLTEEPLHLLVKPFTAEQLRAKVREVLDEPAPLRAV